MDKLRCMEVFVSVVEAGSFAAAADVLGMSAVMVGKYMQQLESQLGVTLIQRSTRSRSLTDVGTAYYENCKKVFEQLRWAESTVERSKAEPQGLLRVSAPVTLGTEVIAPAVARFLKKYKKVNVDLQLTDSVADLQGEGIDVAVRIGEVKDESLIARPLKPYRMVIAAAPSYLKAHGTPQQARDLAGHSCLSHAIWQRRAEWTMHDIDQTLLWPESARMICNQGDALRSAAVQGLGLIMQPEVLLADDLANGRLVRVLTDCLPPERNVNLIYVADRLRLPKLTRFIEFLLKEMV